MNFDGIIDMLETRLQRQQQAVALTLAALEGARAVVAAASVPVQPAPGQKPLPK
ncbi:MAG: hypothetical protein [Microvirus sp.]|nr:MAG: hypothetical protein [Microvirus sp.]